jgi:lysophospholipase L1-like esterase
VINRGYRGYNSRWASVAFKQIFPTKEQRTGQNLPRIRLLTIWLGSNDCVADWKPQHVSPMDFKRELSGIISVTRERSPETHIVLITPGPNQIKKLEAELQSIEGNSSQLGRTNKQVKLYVTATKEVGISEDVPVVDIWEPLWQAAGSRDESAFDTLMTDGVHLQDQGYKVCGDIQKIGTSDLTVL